MVVMLNYVAAERPICVYDFNNPILINRMFKISYRHIVAKNKNNNNKTLFMVLYQMNSLHSIF